MPVRCRQTTGLCLNHCGPCSMTSHDVTRDIHAVSIDCCTNQYSRGVALFQWLVGPRLLTLIMFNPSIVKSYFHSLKQKCLHFDEIFITGCTGSCQNDNFQCSQWLKFRQNDNIFVSVLYSVGWNSLPIQRCNRWSLGIDKYIHPTLFWKCN